MTSPIAHFIPKRVKFSKAFAIVSLASASIFAAAGPARADFQVFIDPSYGSSNPPAGTGVTGTLTFDNFTGSAGVYSFDLSLTNTTPSPPFTSSTFVGTAFNLPAGVSTSLANYNPGTSDFYELFLPASLNLGGGPELYSVGIRSGTPPKTLEAPATQFNGGNPAGGVTIGNTSKVNFIVNATAQSGLADVGLFEAAFSTLLRGSGLQSVGRFQQIDCLDTTLCSVVVRGGSDKVGGGPDTPGGGPDDPSAVPGPLPLLGIGVAYSYSRRLRRRIEKSNTLSQSVVAD